MLDTALRPNTLPNTCTRTPGTAAGLQTFCANTSSVYKVEWWADDTKRRAITGFGVRPGNVPASTPLRYASVSWYVHLVCSWCA